METVYANVCKTIGDYLRLRGHETGTFNTFAWLSLDGSNWGFRCGGLVGNCAKRFQPCDRLVHVHQEDSVGFTM